jgi:hypothetical protein
VEPKGSNPQPLECQKADHAACTYNQEITTANNLDALAGALDSVPWCRSTMSISLFPSQQNEAEYKLFEFSRAS